MQVIEFESTALMIGQLGLRVNLIAYPVVSVKKVSSAWEPASQTLCPGSCCQASMQLPRSAEGLLL